MLRYCPTVILLCAFHLFVLSTSFLYAATPDSTVFKTTGDPNGLFSDIAENIGKAIMPNALDASDPIDFCGFYCGFQVGISNAQTTITGDKKRTLAFIGLGESDTMIGYSRIDIKKSLPFSFVLLVNGGVIAFKFYTLGLGIRYAIIDGTPLTPAISIEANYSSLFNMENVSLQSSQVDFVISQKLGFFHPYAGVARANVVASLKSTGGDYASVANPSLALDQYKPFIGVKTRLGGFLVVGEADFNYSQTYSVKIGYIF